MKVMLKKMFKVVWGVKTGVKKMSHFGEECDMIWKEVIIAR